MRRWHWWVVGIAAAAGVALWVANLVGTGLLLKPVVDDARARKLQAGLERAFRSEAYARAYRGRALEDGQPFGRLRIPSLRVDVIVVEGLFDHVLEAGAGHYPGTAYPGERGNVAIAGHRTEFGAPFRHLDRLSEGDVAILHTPEGRFRYEVAGPVDGHTNPWVTGPNDWAVVTRTRRPSLTLTTTDPPGTDRNRLVVRLFLRR